MPRKVWGSVSVRDVRCRRLVSYLLLLDIPLILLFLDLNLLRTTSPQVRFLQSLLLRIGASANGRDAIDSIIRDLNTRIREGRKCLHGQLGYVNKQRRRDWGSAGQIVGRNVNQTKGEEERERPLGILSLASEKERKKKPDRAGSSSTDPLIRRIKIHDWFTVSGMMKQKARA